MSDRRETHEATIDAPPQAVFDALVDYEAMPSWSGAIRRATVLERDADGRGALVEYDVDAKVRRFSYRQRFTYDEPRRVTSTFAGGDVEKIEGEYLIEDAPGGRSHVRFTMEGTPGVSLPGPLARRLSKVVMKKTLDDLKDHVEATARAGAR